MSSSIAVYPGSFDPITNGHMDIIERALKVVDCVYVAVGVNPKKEPLIPLMDRLRLIEDSVGHLGSSVKVVHFKGLLVDYMKTAKIYLVIRGLRAVSDFEQEFSMALMNRNLFPEMESIFLMTGEGHLYTSSSAVRELAMCRGEYIRFVPEPVFHYLNQKSL